MEPRFAYAMLVLLVAIFAVVLRIHARIKRMSNLDTLTQDITDLEAHAAAVNAERVQLFKAAQAVPPPPPAPPSDEDALAALSKRVEAVSASLVVPVATLAAAAEAPSADASAPSTDSKSSA